MSVIGKIFKGRNERELDKLRPIVDRINALEPEMERLSDGRLRAKTDEFRRRLADGETLDDILPEAFAAVREAAKRTIGQRHFDVQVMGAIVLHQGKIAEMKTGEGKTLAATMPLYLNALTGRGVHLVTVNDYLARRDRNWMGPIYELLGLTVGVITSDMPPYEHKKAYQCDITYGTNNEFGFDYLRDNIATSLEQRVQRGHYYAIVDEVDNVLIDEARTPLIISGPAEESTALYYTIDKMVRRWNRDVDYIVDEKMRTVAITEEGVAKAERFLGLENAYAPENAEIVHHINQAIKAHSLFERDVDYLVKDGQVIIVDEFTGRLMPGRRYSDGLHQALEAKERVPIKRENQTLATISFQNYFRMYEKLAGMTGTAATEAEEFWHIYKLDVIVIPTNKPMIRIDHPDVVYKTERAKFKAIVDEIASLHKRGQPVLVGTVSIEKSERLSKMLKDRRIPHSVLNAKYHEKEAQIIALAGQRGTVTIATNMAGRGTDIVLGEGVAELGGLHVIGTERHESRRIDNQLRGRSGRQGDPGSSRFYLSLEDDLMRLFGSDRIKSLMGRSWDEDVPIEHKLITSAIETAQKRVEGQHFNARKNLLEFDDVMNKQREVIYGERRMILEEDDLRDHVLEMIEDVLDGGLELYINENVHPDDWDIESFRKWLANIFYGVDFREMKVEGRGRDARTSLRNQLLDDIVKNYENRERAIGRDIMKRVEKDVMLRIVDNRWRNHLEDLDHIKEGIGLRAYGQRDPLLEYKRESFELFSEMMETIKEEIVSTLFHLQIIVRREEAPAPARMVPAEQGRLITHRGELSTASRAQQGSKPTGRPHKVGRNDPCPCGSGKKYKYCHGR
ncbi:MAG: preprotein translocase subunit SecA [bacterium]